MLCEKYRMTSHWRLLPVVRDLCRCKPRCNKILGMAANGVHTFFCNIVPILLCQMEFGTEPGRLQFGKCLIDGLHMIYFLAIKHSFRAPWFRQLDRWLGFRFNPDGLAFRYHRFRLRKRAALRKRHSMHIQYAHKKRFFSRFHRFLLCRMSAITIYSKKSSDSNSPLQKPYSSFEKSAAPCLQSGQIKSSGRSSPSYIYPQISHTQPFLSVSGFGFTLF